jgi:hypothetical protein
VEPAGGDLFVVGHAHSIRQVRLELPNGDVRTTRPVGELFVFAVPRAHLTAVRQTARVRGYNLGQPVASVGVVFKLRR